MSETNGYTGDAGVPQMTESQNALYDSAWISKWVRPVYAWVAGFSAIILMFGIAAFTVWAVVKGIDWQLIALADGVMFTLVGLCLAFVRWYFGIRAQDKAQEKADAMNSQLMALASKVTELVPKASSQTVTPATTGSQTQETNPLDELNKVHDYGMPKKEPIEAKPFDKEAFLKALDEAVKSETLGVNLEGTPAYIQYAEAERLGINWPVNNTQASLDLSTLILNFSRKDFIEAMRKKIPEFPDTDTPINWCQDNIEIIKPKCETCKDTSSLMTLDQVMLNLGKDQHESYENLLGEYKQVASIEQALFENGNKVW